MTLRWMLVAGPLLSGCLIHPNDGAPVAPVDPGVVHELLPYLVDGTATRAEIEGHLGAPTSEFEEGRVCTHRLMMRGPELVAVGRESVPDDSRLALWNVAHYSLVLVFDDAGLLVKHRLLRVS